MSECSEVVSHKFWELGIASSTLATPTNLENN